MPEPSLREIQDQVSRLFGSKDAARGLPGTFMWFVEEVGELSSALRSPPDDNLPREFADVLAWLATLANIAGVDLGQAFADKYGLACPRCIQDPCTCPTTNKP